MIIYLLTILNSLLIFFLIFPFSTVLISFLVNKTSKRPNLSNEKNADFACVITAWKNIKIAENLVDSLLDQTYNKYHIYLVADDCDDWNGKFDHERVTILRPKIKLNSKIKSIAFAIENFLIPHDTTLIFDPDNLCPENYLSEINLVLKQGYRAVQGKRTAKNLETTYACLDAASEIYYNYVQKQVPFILGSSSNIAGSGMAIETVLLKAFIESDEIQMTINNVIPGEDKMLQNFLISNNIIIAFAAKAKLFDEKVSKANQLVRQRTRWISSYFLNIPAAISILLMGFKNLNLNQILFGFSTLHPPLFITAINFLLFLILDSMYSFSQLYFLLSAGLIFIFNFLLVLVVSGTPIKIWKNLWAIPWFIFCQLKAIFNMNKIKHDFMATSHQNFLKIKDVEKLN